MLTQTHLYQEIHDQPMALQRLFDKEATAVATLAAAIKKQNIHQVVIAARGTSDNAGRYAQYVLGAKNGLLVTLATPSLFSIYNQPPRLDNTLVLGISQSGKSPDIVAVLAEAKKQGVLTAVMTNITDSDLAKQGDIVIGLNAGAEKAVAATKTYTTELGAVAMLSATLSGDAEMNRALQNVSTAVAQTLNMNDTVAQAVPRYRYMERCVVIGRGFNYSTAFETALKMKELTYTAVEPYSSADFLHGPLALIDQGFPVIVLAPSGVMQTEMQEFMQTVSAHQAEVISISDDEATLATARIPLRLPVSVPEWLSPISTIIPGQLFAMHLAHTRNFDIDSPRGIKKVTETM